MSEPSAGDILREYLANRGWGQADLAQVVGKTTAAVNEIIQGKRAISPEMAALLGAAFDTNAEFWLSLDAKSRVESDAVDQAKRRAHLYGLAPVREMIRRGWIQPSNEIGDLENQVKRFFNVTTLDSAPSLAVATRRSGPVESLNPSQRAWCFRARNIASDLLIPEFQSHRLERCEMQLKKLLSHPAKVRDTAKTLYDFGIRFVVVEPLTGSKIDGAAMWLDESKPIIAVSMRLGGIDSFWFTLFHEFSHIRHGDGFSVDSKLIGEDAEFSATKPPIEKRADEEAIGSLLPQDKLNSFIKRVAPLYSKDRIVQFANRMRVHPGIVVGQLQHRGEINYRANREMLIKVRKRVTSVALVDGWGNSTPN